MPDQIATRPQIADPITVAQIVHLINLFETWGVDRQRLQELFGSGLLPDLLNPFTRLDDPGLSIAIEVALGLRMPQKWQNKEPWMRLRKVQSEEDLAKLLRAQRVFIDYRAEKMLNLSGKESPKKPCPNIAVLSPHNLGFRRNYPYANVLERARTVELDSCPIEIAPLVCLEQLRRSRKCIQDGIGVLIGIEPIALDSEHTYIFRVYQNKDLLELRSQPLAVQHSVPEIALDQLIAFSRP